MRNVQSMSNGELESYAQELLRQENEVLKELMRRGWGYRMSHELEHADITPTEDDF